MTSPLSPTTDSSAEVLRHADLAATRTIVQQGSIERAIGRVESQLDSLAQCVISKEFVEEHITTPVLETIISLRNTRHDIRCNLRNELTKARADSSRRLLQQLLELHTHEIAVLDDILGRYGVTPFESTRCVPFDYRLHHLAETRPTHREVLDKHVCGSLRPGYRRGDRVMKAELVSVYQFEKENDR